MLQCVEAERDHRSGAVGAMDAEDAALLAELVVVERMGRQHDDPGCWSGNWRAYRSAGGKCRPLVWTLFPAAPLHVRFRCPKAAPWTSRATPRSDEHTSELQSLMRIQYAAFCLKKTRNTTNKNNH